jgi:UDP-N-acetylmuramoylalanine--D-glutamate ligase
MRVLVVGLARTGMATALFCAEHGAQVTATDLRGELELKEIPAQLREAKVALELGGHRAETYVAQDLIVVSPGVPANDSFLQMARAQGITIWSEIELAYRFLEGKLIGITGSNGKTTTASLVAHIMRGAGFTTFLAGNVGTPLISHVEDTREDSVTVAELSSFQLELIATFRPDVGAILNLTPDHLDRHGSLQAYGAAKARLFEKQTELDCAVWNADDPALADFVPSKPRGFSFSRKQIVSQGAFVRERQIIFRHNEREEAILGREEIPLPGEHNLENVLAAVCAARLAGAKADAIARGVKSFEGVEHRLEFVAEIGGARYYNDSKATNVDATLKALEAFPGHVIVILGGKDKDGDYRVMQQALRNKAVLALLIGAAAEKIASQITGSVKMERVETVERALESAWRAAKSGDVVLLSPACASFDQFENYEHRGRVFKELVLQLERKSSSASAPGN